MRTLNSQLTVKNETDVRGQAILDLIGQYIPGFVGRYYGYRSLGSHDLAFPAVMLEPDNQIPQMLTTGKYHLKFTYSIYWFFYDNSPDDIVTLADLGAENLIKLFSNNALDDLDTLHTNQFKQYSGYWLTSEILDVSTSRTILIDKPNRPKLMRAGHMRIQIEDIVIK
jgi:hypothetical protein